MGPLASMELKAAQNYLAKRAHVKSFSEEIRCLERGQENHRRSRIKSLDPRMEDGFLVVGGRLQKAQSLPYKTQLLKIIDPHHKLAQLIIEEMHHIYHYPPTGHLLNQALSYWMKRGYKTFAHPRRSNGTSSRQMLCTLEVRGRD